MHFPKKLLPLLVSLARVYTASALPTSELACDERASGVGLAAAQRDALDDFAYLIFEKQDFQSALNKYGSSAVIAEAFARLERLVGDPEITVSRLQAFANKGTAILYYTLETLGGSEKGGSSETIVDVFRLKGTCIAEYLDALRGQMSWTWRDVFEGGQ